jgi:flagella basal body P-ring formation protein FlgA
MTRFIPSTGLGSAIALAAICAGPATVRGAAAWQDLDTIRAAAEHAVIENAGRTGAVIKAQAQALDARLRLPACERPLDAHLSLKSATRRAMVEVRCDGKVPWKIYVTVNQVETRRILVAARSLTRGKVLAADDIQLADREIDLPGQSFLSDPASVVGQTLRRNLAAGEPLPGGAMDGPIAIRAGEEISLESGTAAFRVRAAGVARTAGGLGQTISVQNASSGRVVQAIVRKEKVAEVVLP